MSSSYAVHPLISRGFAVRQKHNGCLQLTSLRDTPCKYHMPFLLQELLMQQAQLPVCCSFLTLLRWRIGCLLLCGFSSIAFYFPFVLTFAELPLSERELILQGWATSSVAKYRKVGCHAFMLGSKSALHAHHRCMGCLSPDSPHACTLNDGLVTT